MYLYVMFKRKAYVFSVDSLWIHFRNAHLFYEVDNFTFQQACVV
jgi:hypothetical protein